jgi:hypothetical protein
VYKFTYFDNQFKSMFSNRNVFWDAELEQELSSVLETLKQYGEVEGASCRRKPGVTGLVYELRGRTSQIIYTVDESVSKLGDTVGRDSHTARKQ